MRLTILGIAVLPTRLLLYGHEVIGRARRDFVKVLDGIDHGAGYNSRLRTVFRPVGKNERAWAASYLVAVRELWVPSPREVPRVGLYEPDRRIPLAVHYDCELEQRMWVPIEILLHEPRHGLTHPTARRHVGQ